jgi:hypothetical protein
VYNPTLIVFPAGLFPSDYYFMLCALPIIAFLLHVQACLPPSFYRHSNTWQRVKITNVLFRSLYFPCPLLLHISKSPAQPISSATYSQNFGNARRLEQVSQMYWRREFPCLLYHKQSLTKLFLLRNKPDLWIVAGYFMTTSKLFLFRSHPKIWVLESGIPKAS